MLKEQKYEIDAVNDEELLVKTVTEEIITNPEAVKILDGHKQSLAKWEEALLKHKKYIEEKGWLTEQEKMEEAIARQRTLIKKFEESVQDYLDKLYDRGKLLVMNKKLKEHYDRKKAETRIACRSAIMSDVTVELGLDDVNHQVTQRLRKEFDQIGVKSNAAN